LHYLKFFAHIYYHLQIAPLTKVEISLSLEVMIALVKFGTLTQDRSFSAWTNIAMSYIAWLSTIHLGKYKLELLILL